MNPLFGQWSGTYFGTVNGDKVRITLEQNGASITGEMQDSQQTYALSGSVQGSEFTGTATETTYQLNFGFNAFKNGDMLECVLVVEMNGERNEVPFLAQRQGADAQMHSAPTSEIPFPKEASFPAALVGKWTQEESYNSGSGDNFMGGNFSQSMTFHGNGTISDHGSNASMSGADYYGQSSGEGVGTLQGLGWYALENNFYLLVFHEGQWVPVELGRWYTENNHLLITSANGQKLLLSR